MKNLSKKRISDFQKLEIKTAAKKTVKGGTVTEAQQGIGIEDVVNS